MSLPKEFYFRHKTVRPDLVHKAVAYRGERFGEPIGYMITWAADHKPSYINNNLTESFVNKGLWIITETPTTCFVPSSQISVAQLRESAEEQDMAVHLQNGKIALSLPLNNGVMQSICRWDYVVKDEKDAMEVLSLLKRIKELTIGI